MTESTPTPIGAEPNGSNSSQFLIAKNGQQTGPFTHEQIQSMLQGGLLAASDLAWKEGMASWQPLAQLLGLGAPVGSVVPPPIPSGVAPDKKILISGYCCAGLALLFCPPGLGIAGIALGIIAITRKMVGHGVAIIGISVTTGIIGTAVSYAMNSSPSCNEQSNQQPNASVPHRPSREGVWSIFGRADPLDASERFA